MASARAEAAALSARGYAEGLERGKEETAAYLVGVERTSREYLQENEARVVALVLAVLKKILGDMDERNLVVKRVRTAMAVVSRQSQVKVVVAPGLVESIKANLDHIMRPYPNVTSVEVVADPSLNGDRCILETRTGRVESSLESQLRTIVKALTDAAPGRKGKLDHLLAAGVAICGTGVTATPRRDAGQSAAPTLCITGKLPSGKKKKDYAEPLARLGVELVDAVSEGLTYLVVADADSGSAKAKKAKKLGVRLVTEASVLEWIESGAHPSA
jgi:type III secretion protein L